MRKVPYRHLKNCGLHLGAKGFAKFLAEAEVMAEVINKRLPAVRIDVVPFHHEVSAQVARHLAFDILEWGCASW